MGPRCSAVVLAVFAPLPLALLAACAADEATAPPRSATATVDAGPGRVTAKPEAGARVDLDATTPLPVPDAACSVVVEAPSIIPANHLPVGTPIAYTSNPPSSGPHYPEWADFREYATTVPDGYLVHALEHGGVMIVYDCEAAADAGVNDCAELVAGLRAVRDAVPTDPTCDPSIRVRVILAPRKGLGVAVAAAAWGFTYRAACLDGPTLGQFIAEHYGKAPENFCAAGVTTF